MSQHAKWDPSFRTHPTVSAPFHNVQEGSSSHPHDKILSRSVIRPSHTSTPLTSLHPGCNTVYHHNYYVHQPSQPDSQRVYYTTEVPKILQVQRDTFVDEDLCHWFRAMLYEQSAPLSILWSNNLLSSVRNASNAIAKIYNDTLGSITDPLHTTLKSSMDKTVVYETFLLHGLLMDNHARGEILHLPHNPTNRDRFAHALKRRNLLMMGTGQEMWAHACNLCCRFVKRENGNTC